MVGPYWVVSRQFRAAGLEPDSDTGQERALHQNRSLSVYCGSKYSRYAPLLNTVEECASPCAGDSAEIE
jgi:hypothetical protein